MPQLQSCIKSLGKALIRRKPLHEDYKSTQLDRCLSTLDLTALGVGSTLGLGIYVLAGQVASEKAGPSVTLSFLIAAIASVFAGLCYAEFGARVPRAGSAYVYSYVTVGEFMAFVIGWNLILEYVIGTASVARGYSGYIDYLVNGTIRQHLEKVMPINLEHVSTFPDFLAFGITMALTAMLAVGVRESSRFNNIFTCLNLLVVVFAVIGGSFKADIHNWKLEISEIPTNAGNGGFLPFGISGMMSGAATCFYGFIGFDCIATTGEEVKNPQKAIPISIVLSLFFVFLAYFGVSAVQTMMCPYYLQNNEAPLPFVFEYVGWPIARWIVAIGALAGLSTSLLGAMFPLPRVLYAMATDGVIFRFLANVHPRFKTPLIATAFSGLFSGCMAMMFKVHELADMMSIGTLLAYSLVAISVLVLRYQSDEKKPEVKNQSHSKYKSIAERGEKVDEERSVSNPSIITDSFAFSTEKFTFKKMLRLLVNADAIEMPSYITSRVSIALIVTACILIVIFDALLATMEDAIASLNITLLSVLTILLVLIIVSLGMLYVQPVEHSDISFKVPLVPFIPMLSVFVNVYLMFKLSTLTWERFGVWMAIGFCVYFFYGLWHSSERKECIDAIQNGTVPNEACLVKTAESPGLGINGPKGSIDSRMSELTVNGVNLEVPSKMSNSDSVCVNTPF